MAKLQYYVLNSVVDYTHNLTLVYDDGSIYSLIVSLPDVTDKASLDSEVTTLSDLHIKDEDQHPLADLVGKESTLASAKKTASTPSIASKGL